jgi:hypothetical protein
MEMKGPLLLLMAVLMVPPHAAAAPGDAPARGRELFAGTAALRGTIAGHAGALPPQGTRCVNCHAVGSAAPVAAPASGAQAASFGPLLTRHGLTQPQARRGGPPSRYDEAAFCRLLRTGIDPAYILITRSMPRYELTDADCRALWLHLTEANPS